MIENVSIVKMPKRTRYFKYRFLASAGHLNISADDSIRARRSPVTQTVYEKSCVLRMMMQRILVGVRTGSITRRVLSLAVPLRTH